MPLPRVFRRLVIARARLRSARDARVNPTSSSLRLISVDDPAVFAFIADGELLVEVVMMVVEVVVVMVVVVAVIVVVVVNGSTCIEGERLRRRRV